ncbi:MAG: hypothetical protein JXR58_04965 [Bacteroidales bacterium]|nr:hypothetical protein [Bacteroidales bacterium]
MSSKKLLDTLISIIFLVFVGYFMYYTKGIVHKTEKHGKQEIVIAKKDSTNNNSGGSEIRFSSTVNLHTFK